MTLDEAVAYALQEGRNNLLGGTLTFLLPTLVEGCWSYIVNSWAGI